MRNLRIFPHFRCMSCFISPWCDFFSGLGRGFVGTSRKWKDFGALCSTSWTAPGPNDVQQWFTGVEPPGCSVTTVSQPLRNAVLRFLPPSCSTKVLHLSESILRQAATVGMPLGLAGYMRFSGRVFLYFCRVFDDDLTIRIPVLWWIWKIKT